MSHYKYHVFFCTNQREAGEACCNNHGAAEMRDYCKQRVKNLGGKIAGKVRINNAGCLDRCEQGPVIVVYPEAVWYTYVDREDIDEIIDSHLVGGKVVERLQIDKP
jgi:(2Fe-2S) ferredoxin